ncbi:MAG: response regulator [Synergistales bacterium]|nr:response regulator [Synergistales bacterium]
MGSEIKLLVIDDSPFIHKAVKKGLDGKGVQIVGGASNGKEGLEKVGELRPDIITLDITMPVMDGLEAARKIRSQHPKVKIIMLSSMGDEELIREAKQIGVHHFLTKPFKGPELLKTVFNVLKEG